MIRSSNKFLFNAEKENMKQTTPKHIRLRTFVILGIGLLVALLGIAFNEQTILIMLGLSLMFLSIIHHVVFYRCPHCGKFLDRSTGEFCPSCGKKVNELE